MKVAVTAKGTQLTDEVDPRFGRAPYILIVDLDTIYETLDNSENVNAFKGAVTVAGRPCLMSLILKNAGHQITDVLFIINYQDIRCHAL